MKIKKKRYKFRLKKIRHVKRKLLLQNLNKKIRNISYTNRLNQSSCAAFNNVFKKNYHHAVSSLLKKTNLLDPEYILKNKSFVLGSLDPKTLKNTVKLTRKGLKVLNFIKRFKKHNDIFTFEEKINFFIKSKSNVFFYKSINKNKKNFFFKKRNKIRITGYFSSEKFSKKIYNLMPRFSNKSFERLSLKWLRKKKKTFIFKKKY